ncbi:DNA polymerase I [Gardnerella greenwoodii]|uniref:DNA polymerase I n=1 Tax=Gardnerella greenwoodii TaxID=2914925 RepID=UPI000370DE3B|nr:DNA polymerase I [Gardnerella greenwoodii]
MDTSIVEEHSSDFKNEKGTLLVVDGHSLAFRAFFAVSADNFSTRYGQATNSVWGFITMLSQVVRKENPDRLAIAFDVKGGTFRNKMLPQYKGTREAAPQELLSQLPLIQQMLRFLDITYIEKPGYEGDDVIGTLATMGADSGYRTLVLSGDRDAFQLIDDNITVLYPGQHFKDLKQMDSAAVLEKYNVTPKQYPDLAALRGETADNIPGVPGVGDGYAAKWINQFGSLEDIISHAGEITGKKGEALRENIDQVRLNRRVNALVRDLDLGISVDNLRFGEDINAKKLGELLSQLEFGELKKRKILKAFSRTNQQLLDNNMRIMLSSTYEGNVEIEHLNSGEQSTSDSEDLQDVLENTKVSHIKSLEDLREWETSVSTFLEEDNTKDSSRDDSSLDAEKLIDNEQKCADLILNNRELVVYAHESSCQSKHRFGLKADCLLLLVNGSAALIYASDLHVEGNSLLEALREFLQKYASSIVLHDYKKHLGLLSSLKLVDCEDPSITPLLDTRLASYLLEPDFRAETLENMAEHYLDISSDDEDLDNQEAKQGELDLLLDDSSALDEAKTSEEETQKFEGKILRTAVLTRLLAIQFAPKLDSRKQTGLMSNLEMPISRVLRGLEDVGAAVDMQRLSSMFQQFSSDAEFAQNMAWQAAGNRVNLQSPKQLQQILFDHFALKPTRRTKNGSYTTNAEALQAMYAKLDPEEPASQFLGALLSHREKNKLKQIVQSLIDAAHYDDKRIHTRFEQTIAATGRLSSADPNLQNIPNRNAAGREIRAAFVPGEDFEYLMSCDYSQVELRIMAHASHDETLIKAFCSGADFHKYVASLVYQIPVDQVSSDQRSHVKAMSYGLAYGLSTYGLAKQLSITPSAAEVLKNKYFDTFGKVHDYLESLVLKAKELGYTETMFGRRRYFPQLSSNNRAAREAAERGALNAPIQGTAADIMKLAMIRVDKGLRNSKLASRVILQIHDELILEIAHGEKDSVENIVREAMEHAVNLDVPLNVSTGVGVDWQLAAH